MVAPPILDLHGTRHAKVFVAPPRIKIRCTLSHKHGKSLTSSTSSRFSFNEPIFSPSPSPGLPNLSPPLKKNGLKRAGRAVRLVIYICGAVMAYHALKAVVSSVSTWSSASHGQYELAGRNELPTSPAPVLVTDPQGKPRWTVSIPSGAEFPLAMDQYVDMCSKCDALSRRVRELRRQKTLEPNARDDHFLDVQEGERVGILPSERTMAPSLDQELEGNLVGLERATDSHFCETSLTFVLESPDAGIGRSLMALWTAYAIAKREGRGFFVDDSRWAYGKYDDMFQPPPLPSCQPPPRHQMLPCPRQARHLVASAATLSVMGTASGASEDGAAKSPAARKAAFSLARQGYEALFRLRRDDAEYVNGRVRNLVAHRMMRTRRGRRDGVAVGIHVRRGDCRPLEFQYRDSYLPLAKYADAARHVLDARLTSSGPSFASFPASILPAAITNALSSARHHLDHGTDVPDRHRHSFLVLASDDPMLYDAGDFHLLPSGPNNGLFRAQEQIQLASKAAIQQATMTPTNRNYLHKYVDDTFGWEGGFFAAMFWNLGATSPSPPLAPHRADMVTQNNELFAGSAEKQGRRRLAHPLASPKTLQLKSLVGRAYIMDLAVLAEASDAVVCGVSAMGCRLLAVMMGWESAVEQGNWVNVDGGYKWSSGLS